MILVTRMMEAGPEWPDTATKHLIGQSMPYSPAAVLARGRATVLNAWVEDGWVMCKFELDEEASAAATQHGIGKVGL